MHLDDVDRFPGFLPERKKNVNEICQNAIFTLWKTLKILRRETTQQSAVDDPTARLPDDTLTADHIVKPFFHLKTADQRNDLSIYRLLNSLPLCGTSYFTSNFAATTAKPQLVKQSSLRIFGNVAIELKIIGRVIRICFF